MKHLLLLRHAKSSWDDPQLPDHDRPLNKRGHRDAPRVGRRLRAECPRPDVVLCSTARRARETAEQALLASGLEIPVTYLDALYLATPRAYLDALQAQSDATACVLVVGHNPGLEDLLHALSENWESLPTAALAELELPIDDWRALSLHTRGKLRSVWRPKELDNGD